MKINLNVHKYEYAFVNFVNIIPITLEYGNGRFWRADHAGLYYDTFGWIAQLNDDEPYKFFPVIADHDIQNHSADEIIKFMNDLNTQWAKSKGVDYAVL